MSIIKKIITPESETENRIRYSIDRELDWDSLMPYINKAFLIKENQIIESVSVSECGISAVIRVLKTEEV